jgi:hypothetical protein
MKCHVDMDAGCVDWVVLTWLHSSILRLFRFVFIHLTLSICFDDYDERALKSCGLSTYSSHSLISVLFHELHLGALAVYPIELSPQHNLRIRIP